jgi:predicted RNA binding protein YcfA (HicA-like mRNA interferase family)
MTRVENLLEKMRENPKGWRIEDLQRLARRLGIDWAHEASSHVVFRHPDGEHLSVPAARPVKPIYVKKFLALADCKQGA